MARKLEKDDLDGDKKRQKETKGDENYYGRCGRRFRRPTARTAAGGEGGEPGAPVQTSKGAEDAGRAATRKKGHPLRRPLRKGANHAKPRE